MEVVSVTLSTCGVVDWSPHDGGNNQEKDWDGGSEAANWSNCLWASNNSSKADDPGDSTEDKQSPSEVSWSFTMLVYSTGGWIEDFGNVTIKE